MIVTNPADGDSAIGSKHYPLNGWIVATPTAITILQQDKFGNKIFDGFFVAIPPL
jgi:hypothetical protein